MNPARHGDVDSTGAAELRALFDAVAELPAAERPDALARIAGATPARIDEVLALLHAAEQGDAFLLPPAQLRAGPEPAHARLGRFALLGRLPDGRTGQVHLARDLTHAAQRSTRLALRIVPLRERATQAVARMRRLAPGLARLEHPALARTLELGLCAWPPDSGQSALYLASEFVPDGVPLHAHRGSGARRLELLLAACDGVAHAHAHGLAHGTLSESNVLVDGAGRVRVLDLGVAALLAPTPPQPADDRSALAQLCVDLLARRPEDAGAYPHALAVARRAVPHAVEAGLDALPAFGAALRAALAS